MSDLTRAEYNVLKGKLLRRKEEIKNLVALFNAQNEVIKEGFGCNKSLEEFPDPPEICDSRILNLESTNQSGGIKKRKSRKKRGKGLVSSKMRRKKHMSARQPKNEYLEQARQILNTYLKDPNIPESSKGRDLRNLALELEDNAKKGGRRRRKSRRKSKKRRKSKRRKTKRRRRR